MPNPVLPPEEPTVPSSSGDDDGCGWGCLIVFFIVAAIVGSILEKYGETIDTIFSIILIIVIIWLILRFIGWIWRG